MNMVHFLGQIGFTFGMDDWMLRCLGGPIHLGSGDDLNIPERDRSSVAEAVHLQFNMRSEAKKNKSKRAKRVV